MTSLDQAMDAVVDQELAEPLTRLSRDLREAARTLSRRDAEWLVDEYYVHQLARIRAAHQSRTQTEQAEPHRLVTWVQETEATFERSLRASLGIFAAQYRVGQWLQAQVGIGPVISAGLLAAFDIRKAYTVGHFWRFAGLDPTTVWLPKQKRPWNAALKTLCVYKVGESFVKTQNRNGAVYGPLFRDKKQELAKRNLEGGFKDRVTAEMDKWKSSAKMKATDCWQKHWTIGQLSPAHIHNMARRWVVKLFLSHLHEVMFNDYYNEPAPVPYIFEHPNGVDHRNLIKPPLWPEREIGGVAAGYDGRGLLVLFGDREPVRMFRPRKEDVTSPRGDVTSLCEDTQNG